MGLFPNRTASPDAPTLTRRTRSSFASSDPHAVCTLLRQHGYTNLPTRSPYEVARLVLGGSLAVVYASGAITAQGSNPTALIGLLEQAAQESEAAV